MIESAPVLAVGILGIFLVGVAVAIRTIPVQSCPECLHCKAIERRQVAERQAAADRIFFRGLPRPCPTCDRIHHRGDPGRRD